MVLGSDFVATHRLPDTGEIQIGRAPNSDVHIDDPSVSFRHATLHLGPPIEIEDLGSTNGTNLRGLWVEPQSREPLALGETFEVGAVTALVQRRSLPARPRRIWEHDYFEGRVEEECERAKRKNTIFALISVACDPAVEETVQTALMTVLRPTDPIGHYGRGEYEILAVELLPGQVESIVSRYRAALKSRSVEAKFGYACYGVDGRTSDALLSQARRGLRGSAGTTGSTLADVDIGRMKDMRRLLERVAPSNISVLILGETGVGKEVMAEEIHRRSLRAKGPFVRLNCAALSESLLESELFGHERGAFTGAVKAKQGLLESANGGSILLDEIGELPMSMQVKLLRVIEERRVRRVGALEANPIDVRLLSATNRDLEQESARNVFRQDLYFRLNGVSLIIPPLRERVGEIEGLTLTILQKVCLAERRAKVPTVSPQAMATLKRYGWPGNIRELRNVLERAVLLSDRGVIGVEHLPIVKMNATLSAAEPLSAARPIRATPTPAPSSRSERTPAQPGTQLERIRDALDRCGGSQKNAAEMLGVSRRTLINWLTKYDLPRPRKSRKGL